MPKSNTNTKFWSFAKNAAGEGELYLYGDISSYSWWEDDISPKSFKDDLDALGDISVLNMYINSGGGDVFAGQTIHTMIKRCKAHTRAYVDGLAASIASVIALGADEVIMASNAMMMIHKAWTFAVGNADDMRKMADTLDKIGESIVAVYKEKTGKSEEELLDMMAAETWMTAQEAVEMGFADSVVEAQPYAASVNGNVLFMNGCGFDLGRFQHKPPVDKLSKEVISSMKFEEIVAKLNPEHKAVVEAAMKEQTDKVVDIQQKLDTATTDLKAANDTITGLKDDLSKANETIAASAKPAEDPIQAALASADPAIVAAFNEMNAKLIAAEDEKTTKEVKDQISAYGHLAISDDMTGTFKNLKTSNPQAYTEILGVLAAADKAVEAAGTLGVKGAGNGANESETTAIAQLQAKAKEIASAENMSDAKAFSEACRRNPDLYDLYTEELMKGEE